MIDALSLHCRLARFVTIVTKGTESEVSGSLRLRAWGSLLLFISGYAPLFLILSIQNWDPVANEIKHPGWTAAMSIVSLLSIGAVLRAARTFSDGGLLVEITKASNKSGDMFSYTVPYLLSFMKIDFGSWQTVLSLIILFIMQFAIAYRTQTVFVNPILALAGYSLVDCTFKRDGQEIQALVLSKNPLFIGRHWKVEKLSHYLYFAVEEAVVEDQKPDGHQG